MVNTSLSHEQQEIVAEPKIVHCVVDKLRYNL